MNKTADPNEPTCPMCAHYAVEHCDTCNWPGCQVDVITPDGPENCGCQMRYDDIMAAARTAR